MKEQFRGLIGYDENEIKELWENAIFVVDTNILINFYKYTSKSSTQSLLSILKKLKDNDRLWIPHQVALEYFFNYEGNMSKQHEGFKFLNSELLKLKESAEKVLKRVNSDHPYIDTSKFEFYVEEIEKSNDNLENAVEEEINLLPDSKKISSDLLELISGIVGESYNQQRIDEIEKEGKTRYAKLIPPGFDDFGKKGKDEYRTYGQMTYQQHYGDLIVWKQMLDKANSTDQPKPLIFLTEDRKKDWWELDRNDNIKRPHPQLIQEFTDKVGRSFYIYKTDRFVELARKYLDGTITEEQVQNVSVQVENIRKVEDQIERKEPIVGLDYRELKRLLGYLPIFLRNELEYELDMLIKDGLTSKINLGLHNNLVSQAAQYALPHIEKNLTERTDKIAHYNADIANHVIKEYKRSIYELNPITKVRTLFNMIDYLNDELNFYKDMEEEMNREWAEEQNAQERDHDWYK